MMNWHLISDVTLYHYTHDFSNFFLINGLQYLDILFRTPLKTKTKTNSIMMLSYNYILLRNYYSFLSGMSMLR